MAPTNINKIAIASSKRCQLSVNSKLNDGLINSGIEIKPCTKNMPNPAARRAVLGFLTLEKAINAIKKVIVVIATNVILAI
jgi:hypothetical protein